MTADSLVNPETGLPALAAFGATYTPDKPASKVARALHAFLSGLNPDAEHEAKLETLEAFSGFIHGSAWGVLRLGREDPRTFRLRLFIRVLRDLENPRKRFAKVVGSALARMQMQQLFTDVGLPMEPGFARELIDRITTHILPMPQNPHRFSHFLPRLFTTVDDAAWLETLPRDLIKDFVGILGAAEEEAEEARKNVRESLADAVAILAARVSALGLAQDIRDRLPNRSVKALPFLNLPRACDALLAAAPPAGLMAADQTRTGIDLCRKCLKEVIRHGEEFGVSIDLVYRVELISAQLGRLEDLLVQLAPGVFRVQSLDVGNLLASTIRGYYQGRSIRALVGRSSDMLARKIIERAGHSGEHYITRTRKEWRGMLLSASGGGVLTAGTLVIKTLITKLTLPAFFIGFFASINYAGSFLLMQALGFTLATKQPAMTAAALAASVEVQTRRGPTMMRRLDRLVDVTARITRSQLAAAVGNVFWVIPTALGFDFIWNLIFHKHFMDLEKAKHTVESLHPLESLTIPFAAFTGVLLWVSSIVAGWVENWAAYRQLPEAIRHSRQLIYVFGRARAEWFSKKFSHAISGVAGNTALGILLAFSPVMASFFGLPLDVRHVTLSTGSLALAGASLGKEAVLKGQFIGAMIGIVIIGALNFGVSFACALYVAIRARDIHRQDLRILTKTLLSRLWRHPFEFIFPPKTKPGDEEEEAPHH